jgi:two-component system cell cycle response regulator DivK
VQPPPPREPRAAPPGLPAQQPVVLVVDDDDDQRLLWTEALAHRGYRTTGERDGVSGVEAALRLRPDVIVMDYKMPGIDGIEATRRIKADPRTRGCAVVLVTGYGVALIDEARAAGAEGFLSKPFDLATLELTLRALWTPAAPPAPEPRAGIVKRCGCGRELSREDWSLLPLCGRVHRSPRNVALELRHCECGSSLALEIEGLEDAGGRGTGRRTALLIDPDPHIRRLVQQFLAEQYDVELFEDGHAALDRARRDAPSVLITDILIPRLNGLELCRLFKADAATLHVPVLIFSVLAAGERALASGANAFLKKPLEKSRLLATLRGLTEREAVAA